MLRRVFIGVVVAIVAVISMVAFGLTAYVHRVYVSKLDDVERILADLPQSEAEPPETFRWLVLRLQPELYESWVARSLIQQLNSERLWTLDWHARNAIWITLLPRRLSEPQLLALYAHYLPLEAGHGLSYGARYYYGKSPDQLSQDELLELLAISHAPSLYSPSKRPERLKERVEYLRSLLQEPAA